MDKEPGIPVSWTSGRPVVSDEPVVAFLEGDGVGPEIWAATRPVLEQAVALAYKSRRRIVWREVLAGEKAAACLGPDQLLPKETLETIKGLGLALKGPLTTPVSSGFRSLNVALRRILDLYACIRPVRYLPGVPAPVWHPERINLVIFRENTEDVYAGIEWPADSPQAQELIAFINQRLEAEGQSPLSPHCALGLKPMSQVNSKRLVRRALLYALQHGYSSLTLVHKGNIMKFTEGAFRDWGYEVAREEFGHRTVLEHQTEELGAEALKGKVIVKDRIADAMFQQLLLRPEEYGILATPNLNGDYLSDAAAALVGGLGMAPGANVGERCAVFEATHGSAPKHAGKDRINPSSLMLSGAEMLRFMGWQEAAGLVTRALSRTISQGIVTYDLARQMPEPKEPVSCSGFGEAVLGNLEQAMVEPAPPERRTP